MIYPMKQTPVTVINPLHFLHPAKMYPQWCLKDIRQRVFWMWTDLLPFSSELDLYFDCGVVVHSHIKPCQLVHPETGPVTPLDHSQCDLRPQSYWPLQR